MSTHPPGSFWMWMPPMTVSMASGRPAFHGYYGHNCYLPLYVFCGDHLLSATLRTADRDPGRKHWQTSAGSWSRSEPLAPGAYPVRGDSGFARTV
ncbi:transposase [Acetobacter ascendens]|uniref:transposase n=1 Tax=Acetobacter ascendens TaxID=481146 RepID=UPI0038CF386E